MKNKLFSVAIFAMKIDPEATKTGESSFRLHARDGEDANLSFPVSIAPGFDLAISQEEAEEGGLRQAKEMWPESEGWMNHAAYAVEIEHYAILESAAAIESDLRETLEQNSDKELLM